MRSQLHRKAVVVALAALCAWSGQASAIDGRDGLFNCKVKSMNSAGTNYWLKVVATSGNLGTLVYTTDSAQATVFTFSRKDNWKHDTGGTSYYMTGAPIGGCVGVANSVTPTVGTPVQTNFICAEDVQKLIVLEKVNDTAFLMRVGGNTTYWFDGWTGLGNGNQIKLNTLPAAPYNANRMFYTAGCRTSDNRSIRPKTGT